MRSLNHCSWSFLFPLYQKSKYFPLALLFLSALIFGQGEQTYFFKNGQRVVGTLVDKNDSTGVYTVETRFGVITFQEDELAFPEVKIYLKSGEILTGELLEELDMRYKIRSSLGTVIIDQDQIDRMEFKNKSDTGTGLIPSGTVSRWYYGDERLIDLFFDPTAYLLEDNILYLSGLSWGYGLTDRIQITSKWSGYFWGDLNARAKIQIFKSGTVQLEKAGALGIHLHSRGISNKYEYKVKSYQDTDFNGTTVTGEYKFWEIVDSGDKPWVEVFGAYTSSRLKASGQGRINVTGGFSSTLIKGNLYNRFYGAVSSDARKNLKLIMEIIYDPYFPTILELAQDKKDNLDISLDFGFVYAYNENFRIGIHYQRPFLAFYYKF